MKRKMRRIHWYTAENEKSNDTKVINAFLISLIILSNLSTMQSRLTFNSHKKLELCCLVIHLTFISTISYAESNGGIFVLIGRIKPEIRVRRSKKSIVRVRD